jgi:hypothetical protein
MAPNNNNKHSNNTITATHCVSSKNNVYCCAGGVMPTISFFYGILIRMFFRDTDKHHLPHIHADYQGNLAVFAIETGELLSGGLPRKQTRLVEAWIEIHKDELLANWRLASNGEKIFPIKGLDA